jgi:hypothetical protein
MLLASTAGPVERESVTSPIYAAYTAQGHTAGHVDVPAGLTPQLRRCPMKADIDRHNSCICEIYLYTACFGPHEFNLQAHSLASKALCLPEQ